MDVLGVGEGGNPWKNVEEKMKCSGIEKGCSRKWRIW